MKSRPTTALIAAALLCGCSQQAKEDYSAAGKSVEKAARDTGQGLKTDTKSTVHAAKAATEAAKNSLHDNSKDK